MRPYPWGVNIPLMGDQIDLFFKPESVAVIGASDDPAKVGYAIFKNALYSKIEGTDRSEGFTGKVYGVNAKDPEVQGEKTFKSVLDIPDPIDLAVIAIPSKFIPGVIDECGRKGIKSVIVITAGFSEIGEEGEKLEHEMLAAAKKHGIRIIGPNCLGVIASEKKLNVSFAYESPPVGGIALLSQSGALCTALISYSFEEKIGYSNFVSLGDKADVDDPDVLEFFARDPATNCIAIYIESLKRPRRFYEVCREITPKIPIVALKSGRTAAGAKAASSHTGSIAGSDAAYEAAFRQAGVQRAYNTSQFVDWSRALSFQPPAKGNRLAIITNAGGPGVLCADWAHSLGLDIVKLKDETIEKLSKHLPYSWSHNNPIDIIGDAGADRYEAALEIMGESDEVDGIVLIMTHQSMTDPMSIAEAVVKSKSKLKKPLLASFIGEIGQDAENYLEGQGIPEYNFPERAVSAMEALVRRGRILEKFNKGPKP